MTRDKRSAIAAACIFGVVSMACSMATKTGSHTGPLLEARRDSFIVRVNGRDVGTQVHVLEKTASGWRFVDMTKVANGPDQNTTVLADANGQVTNVHQRVAIRGMVAVSDLAYANGRIKGMIQLPHPSGVVQNVPIDTIAVPGVVDDNFYAAIMPVLEWAPGATIVTSVFVGGKNSTQQWKGSVLGVEHLTVPAGTMDAYRIAIAGAPSRLVMHVEVAAPHRVLKVSAEGAPFEILRVR